MNIQYFAPAVCALGLFVTPAYAVTGLPPGTSVDTVDYELSEVASGDPMYFETLLDTVVVTATETRDGLLGPDVIMDLYNVTVELTARVWRGSTGLLTFGYDYAVTNDCCAGINGSTDFSISGFAGYDVDYGYVMNSGFFYAPGIDRSADGDTMSVNYFDPRDPTPNIETFLFIVDAPTYDFSGTGQMDIFIDTFGALPNGVDGLPVPASVPLPAGLPLMLMGLGAIGVIRRRA